MATMVDNSSGIRTKGRILIVDDELVVRDSLGKWFTSEGYTALPVGISPNAVIDTQSGPGVEEMSPPKSVTPNFC